MNSRNYLVKMSAGSSDSSKVWNPRKPLVVGHPMRWMVEQSVGGVEVRSLHSDEKHFVKHSEIEKVASIVLAKGAKETGSLKLELRLVGSVVSAHATTASAGSSLRVFFCKGDWTIETNELKGSYLAKIEGRKIFKMKGNVSGIYAPTDTVELEALVGGVKFAGANMEKGAKRNIRFCDISGSAVSFEGSEWKLASFTKDTAIKPFSTGMIADAESQLFAKTLKGALVATLIAGLLAWFLPSEQVIAKKEESVKILLTPRKMVKGFATAAPKGDPNARDFSIGKKGQSKNAGRKGTTVAKNGKVSPAGERKPEHNAVAKAAAKAPAKSAPRIAHTAPKKSPMASSKSMTRSHSVAQSSKPTASKRAAVAAARPVPVPHSELFKALSSSSMRKATAGLLAGGASGGSQNAADSAAEARSLGNSGGSSGRGALGGTGGVSTRSASVSGFGGGGLGNGDGGPGSAGAGYGRGSNSKVSGQGRSFVSMDTGASDVDEGLTRDQINRVISAHMNEVRYCNDSARLRDAGLSGRMTMKISIGASGNVQMANIGNSSIGNRGLHDCIASRVKNWKFPKPKGGVTVGTEFPLTFKSLANR